VLAAAAAGAALAGLEPQARAKARKVAQVRGCHEHDVAAGTTVAAVGPALGHVLLAPEAERPVAAPPGLHVDAGPVVEHSA